MIYHGDALKYIYDTPEILLKILQDEKNIFEESRKYISGKSISQIYLMGSGSSYNAAETAACFGQKILGIQVIPVFPAAFMENIGVISDVSLVVGISQQGTSTAVIKGLDIAAKRQYMTLSVTGEYNTEITRHGDANIYVECGYEDAGATTKGYTATVLTLMIFLLIAGECMKKINSVSSVEYRNRMLLSVRNMETVYEKASVWEAAAARQLKSCEDLIFIAGSSLKGLLHESVLKFSETCRFPVRGFETEEFMHGIYNSVTDKTELFYLFSPDKEEGRRMLRLMDYYREKNVRQYGINVPSQVFSHHDEDNYLGGIFRQDMDFSVLEYAVPIQILFVMTSRKKGIDLNVPRDPEFHKYMGSKLEDDGARQ